MNNPTFVNAIKGGLTAAAIALIANLAYMFAYKSASGINVPIINTGSVSSASIIPLVLVAIVYYFVANKFPKGKLFFTIATVVLGFASIAGSFQATLPDGSLTPPGFAMLTAPMHVFATLAAAFGLPKFSSATK
jgi:hypothetical protein